MSAKKNGPYNAKYHYHRTNDCHNLYYVIHRLDSLVACYASSDCLLARWWAIRGKYFNII